MTTRQEIDHLVETEIHHIEVQEDSVRITHKIIEGDLKTILRMTIEEIAIENKGIEIEVEVETITEILIDSSRDEHLCNRNFNGDRSRVRQLHCSPSREDRRSSGRSISRSASRSGSGSGSRISTNTDRVRCYKQREYDHFASDCPIVCIIDGYYIGIKVVYITEFNGMIKLCVYWWNLNYRGKDTEWVHIPSNI